MNSNRLNKISFLLIALALGLIFQFSCQKAEEKPIAQIPGVSVLNGPLRFAVSFSPEFSNQPLDGRVLLMVSALNEGEPRFQINDGADTQMIFGVDVDGLAPGEPAIIDADVFGYPVPSIADIPAGIYTVQALLHKYETFNRSDGHMVKLPMDRGEGQHWNLAPGNLYSTPEKLLIDPRDNGAIQLVLNNEIPPILPPVDTKYIKHIKIQSRLLTEFWGRPMHLGACILLPEGFDEHPEAQYPLIINHGHFPYTFSGFSETPPDPKMEPTYSARFDWMGYNITQAEANYDLFKYWTAPETPRMIIAVIQHANPYYDDSYAVNSENLGPYGDAITYELIPEIERRFRGLGAGWSRFLYGGSTGGWEALGVQVLYPDEYNGCFAACPDPIDFRAYTVVNLYEDKNAYYLDEQWKRTPRPGQRDWLGHISCTLEQSNHRELVLGTHSRSGDQWDIWEAVYSPCGDDGYPKRIWDKLTGEIDHEVAAYWRENYDLSYIMQRDWATLGPKLEGKVHIYCGDMDNYYLNNAVYLTEEFLESTTEPYYAGVVDYGDRAEHCWNGDHDQPNAISRLRYHQMYMPIILQRILHSAPQGADTTSGA
ncbi:MAG: hypothetical protein GY869_18840, partial [Planctomycetes bacterium]|nr:hypothetical protein [Planctomycetota bacterium]